MTGLVIRGSRNLFIARPLGTSACTAELVECRIKGKILKSVEGFYNPIAPGDIVEIEDGLIVGLKERRNLFARFYQKGQAPQILAANVDLILCVTSPASPPFRPRFIDRVLLQADAAEIPAAVICNKYDLADTADGDCLDMEERLSDYERLGFPVLRISVLTGNGMDGFKQLITDKFSVLVGHSGVGKSSVVNALIPGLEMRTGAINEKFDRGNHTTTQSILLDVPADTGTGLGARIIDTPGIRRFAPAGIPPQDLILHMCDFAPYAGKCSYGLSCSHIKEPGCKILEAVHAGFIHEDRYDSFLRIRTELSDKLLYPDYD